MPKQPLTTQSNALSWLENLEDSRTQEFLAQEAKYTKHWQQEIESLTQDFFQEIKARTQLNDTSLKQLLDNYYYFNKTKENLDYPIHCRCQELAASEYEVILDENELAANHDYFDLGSYSVSRDGQKIVYSQDTAGYENYSLFLKDLPKGTSRALDIHNTSSTVHITPTGDAIFYCVRDSKQRPYQVYRVNLDTLQQTLIYTEHDERFFLDIELYETEGVLLITAGSNDTTEVLSYDLAQEHLKSVTPRKAKVEYSVIPYDSGYYLLTNQEATEFRLAYIDSTGKSHSLIPGSATQTLEDITLYADYLVVTVRRQARQELLILNHKTHETYLIQAPSPNHTLELVPPISSQHNLLHYTVESLAQPEKTYSFDLKTQAKECVKEHAVLDSDFSPDNYHCLREYVSAPDGTQVPLSIVYHKDTPLNGQAPCYLYGYGAYGVITDPWFSVARLSLLDRGGIFALAHVRGSGDCGQNWYHQGKLEHKQNSFSDFIACGRYLIDHNYTNANQLCGAGGSAGGLLVASAAHQAPEVFQLIVAQVPFVDVVQTMTNPDLPLTITEYDEWGDPNKPEALARIAAYCPVTQVCEQEYPNIYATCGINDSRVGYWEACKWASLIRKKATNHPKVWLKIQQSGHGGDSGRLKAMQETAEMYAVVLYFCGKQKK